MLCVSSARLATTLTIWTCSGEGYRVTRLLKTTTTKKGLRNQLYLLRRGQSPSLFRRKCSWRTINLKGRRNTMGFRVRLWVRMLSHVWLFATPWSVALQAPLSMVTLQARILEQVAISFSRESSLPRDQTSVSCIAGIFFTIVPSGKPLDREVCMCSVAQSRLTLCDPVEFPGKNTGAGSHFLLQLDCEAKSQIHHLPSGWL